MWPSKDPDKAIEYTERWLTELQARRQMIEEQIQRAEKKITKLKVLSKKKRDFLQVFRS